MVILLELSPTLRPLDPGSSRLVPPKYSISPRKVQFSKTIATSQKLWGHIPNQALGETPLYATMLVSRRPVLSSQVWEGSVGGHTRMGRRKRWSCRLEPELAPVIWSTRRQPGACETVSRTVLLSGVGQGPPTPSSNPCVVLVFERGLVNTPLTSTNLKYLVMYRRM